MEAASAGPAGPYTGRASQLNGNTSGQVGLGAEERS